MSTVAVKERPILFSDEMVRAILDGRKTQTRRVNKPQPCVPAHIGQITPHELQDGGFGFFDEERDYKCPYGQPGDRLWVREAWQLAGWSDDGEPCIRYAADGAIAWPEVPEEWVGRLIDTWAELSEPDNYRIDDCAADRRWRPSIHMPRWASRITLEITDVRVQRVQDISEDDARAEGIDPSVLIGRDGDDAHNQRRAEIYERYGADERAVFAYLWDRISPRGYAWNTNPWVWAITFRRCA